MESLIDTSEVTSPKCRIFSEELQCMEESKLGLISLKERLAPFSKGLFYQIVRNGNLGESLMIYEYL